jgi:hypothetical protein
MNDDLFKRVGAIRVYLVATVMVGLLVATR